jgi:hypothetical protein
VPAVQADLVAVVDAGRAGQREEQQQRQRHGVGVAAHHPREAGRVVRSQEVELRVDDRPGVAGDLRLQRRREGLCLQPRELLVTAARDLVGVDVARHEAQDGAGERVVHHGIELIALQPPAGVVPDLPHDVGLRVHGPAAAPELAPEGVVVDLAGNVETPAVDAEAEPMLGHPHEVVAHRGRGGVELR